MYIDYDNIMIFNVLLMLGLIIIYTMIIFRNDDDEEYYENIDNENDIIDDYRWKIDENNTDKLPVNWHQKWYKPNIIKDEKKQSKNEESEEEDNNYILYDNNVKYLIDNNSKYILDNNNNKYMLNVNNTEVLNKIIDESNKKNENILYRVLFKEY